MDPHVDVERYREEAARCQREADQVSMPEAKRRLEDIAHTYLKMASQIESISRRGPPH